MHAWYLNGVAQGGEAPARALLGMAERSVAGMQPAAAAAHAEPLFAFLQRALAARPAGGSAAEVGQRLLLLLHPCVKVPCASGKAHPAPEVGPGGGFYLLLFTPAL